MTILQRAAWLAAALVTLVAFGLLVPRAGQFGPESRHLASDTTLRLATATVTVPAGWEIDIAAASQGRPLAIKSDVEVSVVDAVWLGSSEALLDRTASLTFSVAPVTPNVPDGADGATKERWQLVPEADAPASDPRRVVVLRQDTSVVLVIVRGPSASVASAGAAIDAMVASVAIEGPAFDVEAAS